MASSKAVAVILCVFFFSFSQTVSSTRTSELKKSILDQIVSKNANDILIAPGNGTSGPTVVVVFMHILGIDKLNEEKMDFSVRFYLRQLWKDDKLKYDSKGQFKHIVVNDLDLIWTPDTFFSNEKKGHIFDITHPNVFIRIYPDGTVLYSRKISITVACPMNLRKFPFDKQECRLQMGAYGSTTDDVVLLWREYVPVTVSRLVQLPLFSLEKFLTYSGVHNSNTGEFSVLTLSFYFSRTFGHYLYSTFLPCSMLVILSWIPFWLSSEQLTSRLLTSLAPLLMCALIVYDKTKNQAKLSYSTYMDCFTGTCLTLMFVSVIETVIVHVLTERKNSNGNKGCIANGDTHVRILNGNPTSDTNFITIELREENRFISTAKAWISKIPCNISYVDVGARFIMPLVYGIFCIIYFTSISNLSESDFQTIHGNQTRVTLPNGSAIH